MRKTLMSRGMPKEEREEFWDAVMRDRDVAIAGMFYQNPRRPLSKLELETIHALMDLQDTHFLGRMEKMYMERIDRLYR